MPINAIQFGNLSGIKQVQPVKTNANQHLAQNFQNNYAQGELKPVVQNDYLANKLDYFA